MTAKRLKSKVAVILYIMPLFILGVFKINLFAVPAEFEKIKEIEKVEKSVPSERIIRPSLEYKAEGLRDPFEGLGVQEGLAIKGAGRPTTAEHPLPILTVQGLIWGGALSLAIINDKVVKTGDTIDGARITNITKEGVSILFEGSQYNLPSPATAAIKKPQGG